MHQIISTYLVDNYRPLKHVQRSHSPLFSQLKIDFYPVENDRRGVIDVDIVPTMTMLDIPYHGHHRVRVLTQWYPSELNIKEIIRVRDFKIT